MTTNSPLASDVATGPTLAGRRARTVLARGALPLLLVAVIIVAAIATPSFFTFENARAVLINTSVVGILAVGMTPITLSGNFVSLAAQGSTVLATMSLLALLGAGVPLWISIGLVLVLQVVVGAVQGAIVSAGLNPVITTLAAGSVIYGLLTVITGGSVVTATNSNIAQIAVGSFLGLPISVYIFAVYAVVMWFVVSRSVLGRQTTLVGANPSTATISGISVRRVTILAFVSFGIAATVAGVVEAAQLGQVTSGDLGDLTTDVIAAVLVGGVSIRGGSGSPLSSALGALLVTIFSNVMLLIGVPTGVQTTFVGLLVIVLVSALHLITRAQSR